MLRLALLCFALAGAAKADPLLSSFLLAPLDAAEMVDLERQPAEEVRFDAPLTAAVTSFDNVDIATAPVRAVSVEWSDYATPTNTIAGRRVMFDERAQPQFLLTRFGD